MQRLQVYLARGGMQCFRRLKQRIKIFKYFIKIENKPTLKITKVKKEAKNNKLKKKFDPLL